MRTLQVAIGALGLLSASTAAPQTVVWDRSIAAQAVSGATYETFAARILLDSANRLFVSGYYRGPTSIADDNEEFITLRLAPADGAPLWTSAYNTPVPDGPFGAAVDANGDVVVAGRTNGFGGMSDMITLKYARDTGALLWAKSFSGPGTGGDGVNAVATDAAGNVFVGGGITIAHVGWAKTIKYASSSGAILWQTPEDSQGPVTSLAVDAAGDLFEAADISGGRIRKYAGANGAVRWSRFASTREPRIALDPAGNVIYAGSSCIDVYYNCRVRVVKYANADGAVLWDTTLQGDVISDRRLRFKVHPGGDVVIAAVHEEFSSTVPPIVVSGTSTKVFRISGTDGRLLWKSEQAGGPEQIAYPNAVAIDPAGDMFVAAASESQMKAKALRFSGRDGRLLWEYIPPAPGRISLLDLALAQGEIYLVGTMETSGTSYDASIRVIKLAITDADVKIASYTAPAFGGTGKDLVYAVTVANDGPRAATGVVLTHGIPAGASFVWATPGCAPAGGNVVCNMPALSAGQNAAFTIVVRPSVAGTASATVTVTASQPDLIPENNTRSSSVTVSASPAGVPVPRYRLYTDVTKEHHFTTDLNEYTVLGASGAWVQEGTVGKVLNNPGSFNGVEGTPYYRLYNMYVHWHHWTTDPNEYYTLVTYPGWSGEGVDGYILPSAAPGTMQLYRLTYPHIGGLHHWTVDRNEYDTLVASYGWVGEGGSGFVIE